MSGTPYRYAQGDPLTQKFSYDYIPYGGASFTRGWIEARLTLLDLVDSNEQQQTMPRHDDFRELCDQVRQSDTDKMDLILKRFEVTKRVFGAYQDDGRAVDREDFHDLTRYLDFAFILEFTYQQTQGLQYLNALLKVMDILCCYCERLDASSQLALKSLILAEQEHIDLLAVTPGQERHD